MGELVGRLMVSALVAILIKGVVALSGQSISWVWACVVALVAVFAWWLLLSGDIDI